MITLDYELMWSDFYQLIVKQLGEGLSPDKKEVLRQINLEFHKRQEQLLNDKDDDQIKPLFVECIRQYRGILGDDAFYKVFGKAGDTPEGLFEL